MRVFLIAVTLATYFMSTSVSSDASELDFSQDIQLAAPPAKVWQALIDPDLVKLYHLAPLHRIEPEKGGAIIYGTENDVMISGTIVEADENRRLVHTFRFGAPKHTPNTESDPETIVTYLIEPKGTGSKLSLTHTGFKQANQTHANITGGWPFILEQLKAYLAANP